MPDIISPVQLNNHVTGAFFVPANRHLNTQKDLDVHEGRNVKEGMDVQRDSNAHQDRNVRDRIDVQADENGHKSTTVQHDQNQKLTAGLSTNSSYEQIYHTVSLVMETRGDTASRLAVGKQIHGTEVFRVNESGVYEDSDGLYTTQPGIVLGIRVADCAAVLVADTKNGVIGAFHAGWRGAAGGIVLNGVKKMIQAGGEPRFMSCYISPCISLKNFEVGEEVAAKFPEQYCDYTSWDKPHIDLKKFLRSGLMEIGIPETNIEISPHCTMAETRFSSYRREKEKSGRMLACIYLKS